jgi:hypothetical protein
MAVVQEESQATRVPYVPYRTFRNFFETVDPVPNRIDRSVLRYTSGASQTLLIHAFRALDLIDAAGKTSAEMTEVQAGFKSGDKQPITKLIRQTYPTLFGAEFDLSSATSAQLRERFAAMNLSGDTARKAMAFFLAACDDAGIKYSPHFKLRPLGPRRQGGAGRPAAKRSKPDPAPSSMNRTTGATSKPDFGNLPAPIAGILGLLPTEKDGWTKKRRDMFMATFQGALDLCYPIHEDEG